MRFPCAHNYWPALAKKRGLVLDTVAAMTAGTLVLAGCAHKHPESPAPPQLDYGKWAQVNIGSLDDLSIEALRAREYGSIITPEARLGVESDSNGTTLLASYPSDGNRVYTRIDIPSGQPPANGFPVVIFVHGWYGIEKAPAFDFFQQQDSLYAEWVAHFVQAGMVVLSPALRGHGTINGVPAQGIEFLKQWDNGSYLNPMFYAIDVLNLLDGLDSLEAIDWPAWGIDRRVRLDRKRIGISGHSQGGDAVLTALAVSGEGSAVANPLSAGSIISGCFGPRMEQAGIYGPMANTLEAFMSGDGSWTGTATGHDGSVNPEFVFGYPPDWIGTIDPQSADWTWQSETWSSPSVAASLEEKFAEMYRAVNQGVKDISGASFELKKDPNGRTTIGHDPRVEAAMRRIGGFHYANFLSEPLHLHHSDQDYYSVPRWNADLSARINQSGGTSRDFTYPRNNHSLLISPYDWFSPGEVVEGLGEALDRDTGLFGEGDIAAAEWPESELTSAAGLKRYANRLHNAFQLEYQREPLEGMNREVVSFAADGLKQYALIVKPAGQAPENGWPVLLMNHGFHPDPPNNGRTEDGGTDRPGDYYRGLPLAYAKQGFLVVWPDFRGHNISEGYSYTQKQDPPAWYARDAVAAFRALPSLPDANLSQVFWWGHSMGGNVTLRVLQAIGGQVQGASIWSAWLAGDPGQQGAPLAGFNTPLVIQHSRGDPVV
ncbi:MAG: prolyl oligopeptidase family serine peptidase, partial [Xanthomonadales bacterium]|nr:prolyl oligopeptidase family serine peptidase [Xanthomonadales bacterium]